MRVRLEFEPRDCWIGVYWIRCKIKTLETNTEYYTIYVCLVPLLPIVIRFEKKLPLREI